MILYGSYTSPFVRHCRIELAMAAMDYEFKDTDYLASDKGSPAKRVPYLRDGEVSLTDSTSILMYLKQSQGLPFIQSVDEMEHYCLAGTALDSSINGFLLEKEGQTPENNAYVARQARRVGAVLVALNEKHYSTRQSPNLSYNVAEIRTACLLSWGLYRRRFSIDGLDNLQRFLDDVNRWSPFANTTPPEV